MPISAASLRAGDRRVLAKAITLVESTRAVDAEPAATLIEALLPYAGKALRISVSGPPGAGKSTFIDALGSWLVAQGYKPAVLAVDPSSMLSGGSVLGDKTRMQRLSVEQGVFVRPSPASGLLGGVASRTREVILLCEAAGHDVILVETVGVGQSEASAVGMTDIFALLQLPNTGDELQAMKKGNLELADIVMVNKSDLDPAAASRAQIQIGGALRALAHSGARSAAVHCVSALAGKGIEECWNSIQTLARQRRESGAFEDLRRRQQLDWMWELIREQLVARFGSHPAVVENLPRITHEVASSKTAPGLAARRLVTLFEAGSQSR